MPSYLTLLENTPVLSLLSFTMVVCRNNEEVFNGLRSFNL